VFARGKPLQPIVMSSIRKLRKKWSVVNTVPYLQSLYVTKMFTIVKHPSLLSQIMSLTVL